MSRETIISRIERLCERDNIDLETCREETGVQSLHKLTVDDIRLLSQYFDCTTDYLINGVEITITNREKQTINCMQLIEECLQTLKGEKGKVSVKTETIVEVNSELYVWSCEITARPAEELNKVDQKLIESTTVIDKIDIIE